MDDLETVLYIIKHIGYKEGDLIYGRHFKNTG